MSFNFVKALLVMLWVEGKFGKALEKLLQLEAGETSADGKWTLITTSCLGLCGVGPVIVIDEDAYGNVTADQVAEILEDITTKEDQHENCPFNGAWYPVIRSVWNGKHNKYLTISKREIKSFGLQDEISPQQVGDVGRHDALPLVIVYPEAIIYGPVKPRTSIYLVEEHLIKGRIASEYRLQLGN